MPWVRSITVACGASSRIASAGITGSSAFAIPQTTRSAAITDAMTIAAARAAEELHVRALLCISATGFTALSGGNGSASTINISGTADVTLPAFPTTRGTGASATISFDGGILRPGGPSATYLGGAAGISALITPPSVAVRATWELIA